MHFTIRGENIEVTNAIRAYVEEKIAKIERYFDQNKDANPFYNENI